MVGDVGVGGSTTINQNTPGAFAKICGGTLYTDLHAV